MTTSHHFARPGRPYERGRHAVVVDLDDVRLESAAPVQVFLDDPADGGRAPTRIRSGYTSVETREGGFEGLAVVDLPAGGRIEIRDTWSRNGPEVLVHRRAVVTAAGPGGFCAGLALGRPSAPPTWAGVEPFAPGLAYGDSRPVAQWAIGGLPARRAGVRSVLVREDRLAAPVFALWYPDRAWVAALHLDPDAATIACDGEDVDGADIVDEGLRYASLGADLTGSGLELGLWFPGTEGECTYSSGGLPLRQLRRWRRRFHPLRPGMAQEWSLAFRSGTAASRVDFFSRAWRWSWQRLRPRATHVPTDGYLAATARVLASQVRTCAAVTGIGLESDPTTGRPLPGSSTAVMGFVGANTDAAMVMLRAAEDVTDPQLARDLRTRGTAILDTFATLELDPPVGEGFDLRTGRPTTYRTLEERPAVFLRALAEGCRAALRAWRYERDRGTDRESWRRWGLAGASWLLAQQRDDGSWPRAWEAGTGVVLQDSTTATALAVPLLVTAEEVEPGAGFLDAARAAGTYAWMHGGRHGSFAGATLDNPDVVDKEASVLALEAHLALHRATADDAWLERAAAAARVAETWVHTWNPPMPADADPVALHWKPGRSIVGMQLITSGASMSDGFLAVNAAAFADLARRTGDRHFLDVARLVHHGSKAMLATTDDRIDLAGPGWQQEHWGFATCRGYGLNRSWLPWAAVATLDGVHRLRDLGYDRLTAGLL